MFKQQNLNYEWQEIGVFFIVSGIITFIISIVT